VLKGRNELPATLLNNVTCHLRLRLKSPKEENSGNVVTVEILAEELSVGVGANVSTSSHENTHKRKHRHTHERKRKHAHRAACPQP
jgi:hypothetical protein